MTWVREGFSGVLVSEIWSISGHDK